MISIIMPTYNCADFIAMSVSSVKGQTYSNWELLIVDDCSTDDTWNILQDLIKDDKRIKYFRLPKQSGAAEARNFALMKATGQYVAFLDSDDLWMPEKLERQLDFMEQNGYAFTYHEYTEIDEKSHPLGIYVSGKKRVNKFDMFACCWPGCLTVMYNREIIGDIQIENIAKNNDTAMWLKVIRYSNCYLLKENLAKYRRRKGSITPSSIGDKIYAHYPLFRVAEHMSPLQSWFWTCMNVLGNGVKKMLYVRKI